MLEMLETIWAAIRREPAILNGLIAAALGALAVLVDVLEASGSTLGGFVALMLAQALGTRRRVTPV